MDITNNKAMSHYMDFIMDFHSSMKEHQLQLVYEGEVTQEVVKAFTALAERNLERHEEDGKVAKKVYHVMVECLQNIAKHADDKSAGSSNSLRDGLNKNGIFVVGKDQEKYFVTSGNPIAKDKVQSLQEMLDHINSLDKEGIKALYKEKIKASRLSETGGAGLGFIDMVKKTGNELVYCFKDIDENNSFFLLRTKISR